MKPLPLRHFPGPTFAVSFPTGYWLALLVLACLLASGCAKSEQAIAEAPPLALPSAPDNAEAMQSPATLPPPTVADVRAAVQRVFKDAAALDQSKTPTFVTGDFNGDLSPDLAVILKPAPEKLSQLNEDFPNWILRDPFSRNEPRGPRLRVAANETLLAVIHGFGPIGWRDPQATQTFLLKNAGGSALQSRPGKEALANSTSKKLPQLRGDVIGEDVGSTSGYLYYVGASYSWYDPKTFKGDEPLPAMVHSGPRQMPTETPRR
jgi:hypothetical protein